MILPIKPICRKQTIRRDGTSIIFLQYCFSAERRVLVDTGIAIPPEYWNRKNNRISPDLPTNYGHVDNLEKILSQKLRRAEDLVNYAITNTDIPPARFLKEKFKSSFELQKSNCQLKDQDTLDIFYHIDEYKKSKKDRVRKATLNVINAMKIHLQYFEKHRKRENNF